jgi:hypothetical protein
VGRCVQRAFPIKAARLAQERHRLVLDGGEGLPPGTVIESIDSRAAMGHVPERQPLRTNRPMQAKAQPRQLHHLGSFGIQGRCREDPFQVLSGDGLHGFGPSDLIFGRRGKGALHISDRLLGTPDA